MTSRLDKADGGDEAARAVDRLRQELDRLRQEHEQLLVKLETAEAETVGAAEQVRRLEAGIKASENDRMRQRQIILELRDELARHDSNRADFLGNEVLREELQLANEELRVSHEELEAANRALQEANERLEAHVAERTSQLERVVLQLSDSIAERDALLESQVLLAREADHRVKNSLQMVISLLAMQASAADIAAGKHALQQACSRVQAIARTHALLYKTAGPKNVPFHDYLAALCQDLRCSLAPDSTRRRIECHSDPAEIPADYALPLALVVNELVTNACKHAFPGERAGRIEVSFRRRKAHSWRLTVADDGIGVRGWPPPASAHSLGARIVGALVERLHGKLAVAGEAGTRFTLDIAPHRLPD